MQVSEKQFGVYNGEPVTEYTFVNDSGMSVSAINYGCVINKIIVPDKDGNFENVVLGFDDFDDYPKFSPFFGAVVGRVAGRIKNAQFELDGKEYNLAKNEHNNHLHGGVNSFDTLVWGSEIIKNKDTVGVKFHHHSPDGEEGYPGNLDAYATYLLNSNNELIIILEAKTDKKTIVNLANHSYFNLSGNLKRDITEHFLQVDNNGYLELDKESIPTGNIIDAEDTPFDFKQGKYLEEGIKSSYPQNVLVGKGYDHALSFTNKGENIAVLTDKISGRKMIMTTDQPCFVLYTGNMLKGYYSVFGVPVKKYLGVCLEAQGFPDAVHNPQLPSIVLRPDEEYCYTTKYRFIKTNE